MEERAMRLQKVALARRAVELAPGAPTGMPVRAQIATPAPALIVTMAVRTEVHGGIDLTGPPVRRCHRGGRYRRRRWRRRGLSLTQGTMRFVRQARKRVGCSGARAS